MITLLQNSNYLIGSQSSIEALKTKHQARILTVSDTHGAWRSLVRIVKQFGSDCDALILAGDCWRDLEELLELADEDKEFCKVIPPVLAFVRGNRDPRTFPVTYDIGKNNPEARTQPKGTVLMPDSLILNVNGHNILLVHGHIEGVDFGYNKLGLDAKLQGAEYVIHGHTHVPILATRGDFTFINPGSVSRPRGGQPASFAILTADDNFIDAAFIRINDPFGDDSSYSVFNPLL